jgi:hypothetical protein
MLKVIVSYTQIADRQHSRACCGDLMVRHHPGATDGVAGRVVLAVRAHRPPVFQVAPLFSSRQLPTRVKIGLAGFVCRSRFGHDAAAAAAGVAAVARRGCRSSCSKTP